MEQLINPVDKGRLMEVQMLMRKIHIRISREQFNSFLLMIQLYMTHCSLVELQDKSTFFRILKLYERLRSHQLRRTPEVAFSVDISVGHALLEMLDFPYYIEMGVYESILRGDLIRQIDHQTA